VASVDAFLISDGSSFQSRGAATLNSLNVPNCQHPSNEVKSITITETY